jgi:hypothetical protein
MSKKIIYLTPPQISNDYIKEKIVCIRAHRERLFNVSTQFIENKLICHNYGHGGAGWTFLFGCVHESIRQFEEQLAHNPHLHNQPIAVVGAGCYGLLTAIMLARKKYRVHIVASETQDIPSNKAAGFFFPRPRKSSTPEEIATFLNRGVESYETLLEIIKGTHPFIKYGPKLLPAYYGPEIDPGFAPYIERGLIAKPEEVIIDFGNGKSYPAVAYNTVFINSAAIMAELQRNINELKIPIVNAHIDSWNDLSENIIFNCSGMSSKKLVPDNRIIPVQGHLITLKNQDDVEKLQYMINVRVTQLDLKGRIRDELIYFAPKDSGILGISFIRGQDSLTANQHEFDRLLERCHEYFGT